MSFQNVFSILFLFLTAGCAIAPVSTNLVGRTHGQNSFFMSGGYSSTYLPDLKGGIGVTDDLDIWAHYDMLTIGLGAKYSLINQQHGFSMAMAVGTGVSSLSKYYYTAPVFSYKGEKFEPYFVTRFNYVDVDEDEVNDIFDDVIDPEPGTTNLITNLDLKYWQFTVGSRFWMQERLYLGAEANILHPTGSNDDYNFRRSLVVSIFVGGYVPNVK